jgi:hypothetical protein
MAKKTKPRKYDAEYWKKMTFNAWYLPYIYERNKVPSPRIATNTLWLCDKCNNVYSFDSWGRKVMYYMEMPRMQKVKTCQKCEGKTEKVVYL